MKKYLLVFLLFLPLSVLAQANGTCSDHGGVDCNVGSDWDGSAVCNDGWRHSTEIYSTVLECKNVQRLYCNNVEYSTVSSKYPDISTVENQLISLYSQIQFLQLNEHLIPYQIEQRYVGSGATTGGIQPIIDSAIKANEYNIATSTSAFNDSFNHLDYELGQIDNQCKIIGQNDYNEYQQKILSELSQSQNYQQQPATAPIQNVEQSSTVSGCSPGYYQYNNQCVDFLDYCSLKLGPKGIVSGQSSCGCAQGYTLNADKSQCIAIPKLIINSPKVSSKEEVYTQVATVTPFVVQENLSTTTPISSSTAQDVSIQPKLSIIQRIFSWFRNWFR